MSTKDKTEKPIKSDSTDRSTKHGGSDTQDFGVNLADPSTRNILGTMSARPGSRTENDALSFDTEGPSTSLADKWQKFLKTPYTTPGAGDLTHPPEMPGPSDAPTPEAPPTHSGGKVLTGTDSDVKGKPTKEGPIIISEYEPPYQDPRTTLKPKDTLPAGDTGKKGPNQQNGLTPSEEDRKVAQADLDNSRNLFSKLFTGEQNEQIANIQNSLVNGNFEAFTQALHDAGQSSNGRLDALGGAQLGLDNGNAGINLKKDGDNVLAYSDTGNYALQVAKDGSTSVRRITRDADGNVTVQPGEVSPDEKTAESVFGGLSNHAVNKLAAEYRGQTAGGALTAGKENPFENPTQQKPLPKKEPVIIEENPMPKPVPPPPKVPRDSDGNIQAKWPPRDDSGKTSGHADPRDKAGDGQVGDQGPKLVPDINRLTPTPQEREQASVLLLQAGMKNHEGLTSDQSSKAHDVAQALVDGQDISKLTDTLRAAAQDASSDAIFSAIEKDLQSVGSGLSIQRFGDTVQLSDQSGKNAVSINLATGAASALDAVPTTDGRLAFVGPVSQSADAALRGLSMNLVTDARSHHDRSQVKPKSLFDHIKVDGPKPVFKRPQHRNYLESALPFDSY